MCQVIGTGCTVCPLDALHYVAGELPLLEIGHEVRQKRVIRVYVLALVIHCRHGLCWCLQYLACVFHAGCPAWWSAIIVGKVFCAYRPSIFDALTNTTGRSNSKPACAQINGFAVEVIQCGRDSGWVLGCFCCFLIPIPAVHGPRLCLLPLCQLLWRLSRNWCERSCIGVADFLLSLDDVLCLLVCSIGDAVNNRCSKPEGTIPPRIVLVGWSRGRTHDLPTKGSGCQWVV